MLSLRFAIVTAAAGLCLWGLFSLLDSLQEPGLLRSGKATAVKGCDSLESEQAARLCPALFCQKALLDAKLLPLKTSFEVQADRKATDGRHLIGGAALREAGADRVHFACEMVGTKVTSARVMTREELTDWLAQSAGDPS